MANEKRVLGHIDCPYCGIAKGMRITHDRNGQPFGFCESNCSGQLRVGGDRGRVAAFVARYPWAAAPVTVTGAPEVAPVVPEPVRVQEAEPVPVVKKTAGLWFEGLSRS